MKARVPDGYGKQSRNQMIERLNQMQADMEAAQSELSEKEYTASAGGGMVHAAFVDEGQGMTQSQMRRAFDRYYRAKTVLEAGKGGFGIGLCTAREFARAMGGDLVVEGNAPKGCVFTLSLPAWPRRTLLPVLNRTTNRASISRFATPLHSGSDL